MEGINTNLVDKLLITPINVKDGIRAGAFQGMGFLGKAPGIYLGDVFPYSISPYNDGTVSILTGTIPANASIYLPLGNINFVSLTPGVTKLDSPLFPGGKCIKLDYERTLEFACDQAATITTSCMDRYLQKMVVSNTNTGLGGRTDLGPAQYFQSIRVKNNTSNLLTYNLYVGAVFGVPYNMLYDATTFTKMLVYDGFPLVTSNNVPSAITWLPTFTNGYSPETTTPPGITTGFTRTKINFNSLFVDGAPFEDKPFDGSRILTMYTQHYGFGNLPPYVTRAQQLAWLNNNNTTIIGVKPFSEGFTPWFR
jgi:hypothetical protein